MEEQSNEMDIEEINQFSGVMKKKRILIGDKDLRVRRDNMDIIETLYNGACKSSVIFHNYNFPTK